MNFKTARKILQIIGIVFIITATAAMMPVPAVHCEKPTKNIRVGWYESPFNTTDDNGRRSGYAYEYQLKLASYAGCDFTYTFLLNKYPNWRKVYYKDISECLKAVSDNIADCVLISK